LFFGHNTGVNAPRMLHDLQDCAKRGVPIIVFNPLRERGHERFTNPQNPVEMLVKPATRISSQYHQINVGGDKAALMGLCKAVLELDDAAKSNDGKRALDVEFIAEHTHGFAEFEQAVRAADWSEIEHRSGLTRGAIESAAFVYTRAESAMIAYGMGLTQQVSGVENVQMIVNLLLLRGNVGKPGAGILPVRGHSNVQGQRTVGITEKPDLVPNDKLKALYGFDPPRDKGLNCVEAAEGVMKGSVRAVFQLGGNLVRSLPDRGALIPAWRKLRLTVQIVDTPPGDHDVFQLTTIRSQGQFNTTIYSDRDRFRGVSGSRMVLFMNSADERAGLEEGAIVGLTTAIDDGIRRHVGGFTVHRYNIPEGCLAGYYPECNPLVPLSHHAKGSFVPASKGNPVRLEKTGARAA